MGNKFVLAIDQGTTGSRAIVYDAKGEQAASAYQEFRQYYPRSGWVEHDAGEILSSVYNVIRRALSGGRIKGRDIAAIGITNQRESVVLWDRRSGRPFGRVIVWQDRRTEPICNKLRQQGLEREIHRKTGLLLDPYFSGTKLTWLFANNAAVIAAAKRKSAAFGTVDSWLLYHLTGRMVHATDFTNASRTLLFDIRKRRWDTRLCRLFKVPESILPHALPSNALFGHTLNAVGLPDGIPIHGVVGDQQAALYGQGCYRQGESKNTYGTGSFLLFNTGRKCVLSHAGLLTTLALDKAGESVYALEGSIFITGAAIQWLRDGLRIISHARESEAMAHSVEERDPVIFVPAFTGLGAPYWRPEVRGAFFGITRGTTRSMIAKSALDAIAYQVGDVFDVIRRDSQLRMATLKVDGGASENRYLMQRQADLLGVPVLKSNVTEATAWGAAKLAGVSAGFWRSAEDLDRRLKYERYRPTISVAERKRLLVPWRSAIRSLLSFTA